MPMPPIILDAPALGPSRRSGLFLAATGPGVVERHAETSGARWWSNACGSAHLYPPACSDSPYSAPTVDDAAGLEDAFPVVVYASIVCPPVGNSAEKARADVTERLMASEQRAVERALWGGEGTVPGVFQQLAAQTPTGVTLLSGTAATVTDAVSQLEQQSSQSNYDGQVLIHARPRIAAYAGHAGLLKSRTASDGEHQFTHYGSEVVFGAGYAGSSPDNVTAPDATTEYMAATGRVLINRSEIFYQDPPNQVLNKVTNQRTLIAWRVYTVAVECFAAMIKVTRA
jgi:hypothetical protein